jgi:hypothetical protein
MMWPCFAPSPRKFLQNDGRAKSSPASRRELTASWISSRAVLGEYQPHKRDRSGKRVQDGAAIKGYYPAIIDEGLWIKANAAVARRQKGAAGRPQAEAANLIRGLARCTCGARMEFINKGRPPKGTRYYVCESAARQAGCERIRKIAQSRDGVRRTKSLARVAQRPDPQQWRLDELVTLAEAAALLWPNGPIGVSTLRTAIRAGDLAHVRTAAPKLETGVQRDAAVFRSFEQAQDRVWTIFDNCDNFARSIFTDFTNRSIVEKFPPCALDSAYFRRFRPERPLSQLRGMNNLCYLLI